MALFEVQNTQTCFWDDTNNENVSPFSSQRPIGVEEAQIILHHTP